MIKSKLTTSTLFFETCIKDSFQSHTSLYLNTFNELESIIKRISCLDKSSKQHIAENENFKLFISHSLDIIDSESPYNQTKLEKIEDDGDIYYRLTYYIQSKILSNFVSYEHLVPENRVYNVLLKNLSNKTKELRRKMILDERLL